MPASDGTEPVADEEFLYRRIPVSQDWYRPARGSHPTADAFRPRKDDTTGLSVNRAKYKTAEEAARGASAKGYYVAVLRARDLRRYGIEVIADPLPDDSGHALLPGLTYSDRESQQIVEWMAQLADELCLRVEGPFVPNQPPQGP